MSARLDRLGERRFAVVALLPGLVLVGLVVVPPVLAVLTLSLFRIELLRDDFRPFVGLGNFLFRLPGDAEFLETVPRTLVFAFLATALGVPIAMGAALLVNGRRRGGATLGILLILPWAVAPIAAGVFWRLVFDTKFGLVNGALGVVGIGPVQWTSEALPALAVTLVAVVWRSIPLLAVLLLGALRAVPLALGRAARMDGASSWQVLRYITLPAIRPTLIIVCVVQIVLSLQVFDILFAITRGAPRPHGDLTGFAIYTTIIQDLRFGYGSALTVVLAGIIGLCLLPLIPVVRGATVRRVRGGGAADGVNGLDRAGRVDTGPTGPRLMDTVPWERIPARVHGTADRGAPKRGASPADGQVRRAGVTSAPDVATTGTTPALGATPALVAAAGKAAARGTPGGAGASEPVGARQLDAPRRLPRFAGRVARGVGTVALVAWLVGPMVWLAIASVQPESALRSLPPKLTLNLTLDGYTRLLNDPTWQGALFVSLEIGIAATVIAVLVAILAGYPLARYRFRGSRAVLAGLLVTQLIPPIALAIPVLFLVIALGVKGTVVGLILVNAAFWTPILVWLVRAAFMAVPLSLELAARMDGAGRLGAILRVALPSAAPGIAAAAVIVFVGVWNDFVFVAAIGGRATSTLPRFLTITSDPPFHVLAAGILLTIAPCLVLVAALYRRILRAV